MIDLKALEYTLGIYAPDFFWELDYNKKTGELNSVATTSAFVPAVFGAEGGHRYIIKTFISNELLVHEPGSVPEILIRSARSALQNTLAENEPNARRELYDGDIRCGVPRLL